MRSKLIIIALSVLNTAYLSAAVIINTNIELRGGQGQADYRLTVLQEPSFDDPTSMFFNVSGSAITYVAHNLDEGSDWYLTSYGDEFSEANILADSFQVFVRVTAGGVGFESNVIDVGLGSFYLGVNTGNREGVVRGNLPPRNLYGWVELENHGGSISMLSNAMSYEGTGIKVGTAQSIPEPSVCTLLLGGILLAIFRRRSTQSTEQNGGADASA